MARRAERTAVKAITPDFSLAAHARVDRAGETNCEPLHAPRDSGGVVALDDEVDVVVLDGEVDDAKCRLGCFADRLRDHAAKQPQRRNPAIGAQGNVERPRALVARARAVGDAGAAGTRAFASSAGAATAPGSEAEWVLRRHLLIEHYLIIACLYAMGDDTFFPRCGALRRCGRCGHRVCVAHARDAATMSSRRLP